ncbi:zinc finger protein 488 [Genypterus blacodes]|uniref:zinc finger protein 488 n=1 Tax=Genypterus blacodes TaxID=154954 RepID=UPI003F75DE29
MDPSYLPRALWSGDRKLLQHPADFHTSVIVTSSIPAGTSFGPCLLQNTTYDSIAFIAQKSCDKRTKACVFRVDAEAMHNSALVLSWLRLAQAARNREEQNTEVCLRAGQLYVRTTRDVEQEEELLVWYDQELSHLLGFTHMTARGASEEFTCGRCSEVFKNEFPFLAHCRFLCAQVKNDTWSLERKDLEVKRQHRVTDFHNIARDLEHKQSGNSEDAEISSGERKCNGTLYPKGGKTEKTFISDYSNITQLIKGCNQAAVDASASNVRLKNDRIVLTRGRENTFTDDDTKCSLKRDVEMPERGESSEALSCSGSAFSLLLSDGRGEQRSAFCKPSKRTPSDSPVHRTSTTTAHSSLMEEMSDSFSSKTSMGYNNLIATGIHRTALQTVSSTSNSFHFAPERWPRNMGAQLQTNSSLMILPSTYTSFGVSVQNWCAKCNLSFRMTSDLVFHMRSHHKKEFAVESQVRRRREEKLTCTICHEYFRERHHLSRHMTSHN